MAGRIISLILQMKNTRFSVNQTHRQLTAVSCSRHSDSGAQGGRGPPHSGSALVPVKKVGYSVCFQLPYDLVSWTILIITALLKITSFILVFLLDKECPLSFAPEALTWPRWPRNLGCSQPRGPLSDLLAVKQGSQAQLGEVSNLWE